MLKKISHLNREQISNMLAMDIEITTKFKIIIRLNMIISVEL